MSNSRVAEYIIKLVGQNAQLIGQVNQVNAGLSQVSRQANAAQSASDNLMKKIQGIGVAAGLTFSAAAIINYTKEAVNLAGEAEGVRTAFAKLNRPELLDDLKTATRGTTGEISLMQAAIQAKNFKIPLDQLATYFKFATTRAIETGQSVDYLVQSLIMGIGRQSPLILDNLGLSAKEISNEFQRTGNFGQAVGDIIKRELGASGDVADTAATKIQRYGATIKEIKEQFGQAIVASETFNQGLDDITDLLYTWTNKNISTWKAIGITLDQALWGSHGAAFIEYQKLLEKGVDDYSKMEAAAQQQGLATAKVNEVKTRTLAAVKEELAAAVEEQASLNSLDTDSVRFSVRKVSALTLEKEALEKLYAVQRPRENVTNLSPMEQRLNITPVVSTKKVDPLAGLRIKPQVTYESDTLKDYSKELGIITQKQLLYGNALGTVIAKKEATQAAIDGLLSEGYAAESLEVQKLMGVMDQYNAQQTQIQGISEKTKEALSMMGGAFGTLGNSIGGAAGEWLGFAGTLMEQIPMLITQITAMTAAQVVGSTSVSTAKGIEMAATASSTAAKLTEGVVTTAVGSTEMAVSAGVTSAKTAEAMTKGLASSAGVMFPGNLVAMALVLGTIGAIIASIPKPKKFASGGIISGPTLGLMGEYPGASNNPEVVAPLSKLKGMINDRSGAMDISVQDIVLTGSQLRIIQKATSRQLASRS